MIQVILAEDSAVIRAYIQKQLDRDPAIQVTGAAGSGRELVRLAEQTRFDIALIDVDMETPVAGIIAAGRILALKPEARVVFLTMHEEDETILSAIETGGVDYVVKSDDMREAIEHIKNAYAGSIRMQPRVSDAIARGYRRLRRSEGDLLRWARLLAALTPAEKQLIRGFLAGRSVAQIAAERQVEVSTIKSQINRLLKKLGARRTREVTQQIREQGLDLLFEEEPAEGLP